MIFTDVRLTSVKRTNPGIKTAKRGSRAGKKKLKPLQERPKRRQRAFREPLLGGGGGQNKHAGMFVQSTHVRFTPVKRKFADKGTVIFGVKEREKM